MNSIAKLTAFLLLSGLIIGCGSASDVKPKQVQVKVVGPFDQAKALLTNYANGNAVGSESTGFGELIESAKKEDPAKGDILEKGLKEIEKSKASPKAKAKELMTKLGM
jgi:hypothetical protein